MMITTGFKVVDIHDRSAWVREHNIAISYTIDKWAYPTLPKSKLFAFKTLNRALQFREATLGLIYTCELLDECVQPTFVVAINQSTSALQRRLLSCYWDDPCHHFGGESPMRALGDGVFASAIKLRERIKSYV